MSQPLFVSDEKKSSLPVLIIDRQGFFGLELASFLHQDLSVYLVGGEKPKENTVEKFILFGKKVPKIPQEPYSHIFLVYDNEKEFAQILQGCYEKTQSEGTKLLVLLPHQEATESVLENITSTTKEASILILGDIFGDEHVSWHASPVQEILMQTATTGKIKLSHMGLENIYPIYYKDALTSVLHIAFGLQKSQKPYLVAPKHPLTELAFVHQLQKIDPEVQVDFVIQKETMKNSHHLAGEYLFDVSPNFELIKTIYQSLHKERKEESIPFLPPQKVDKKQEDVSFLDEKTYESSVSSFGIKPILFFLLYLLLCLVLLPGISTLFFLLAGRQALLSAKSAFEKADFSNLQTYAKQASLSFVAANKTAKMLSFETQYIGTIAPVSYLLTQVSTGTMLSDALTNATTGIVALQKVISGASSHPDSDFTSGINALKNATVILQKMQIEKNLPPEIATKLPEFTSGLSLFTDVSDILPSALGIDGKRTYLVLFQNNMELRPGGGFIGSYGLINLQKGKLANISIHDVYDADGQLKGHIEPPYPIRRYLPSAHWYMRDSNFDVDFAKSASTAAFFLSSETGVHVDGVIGIDLSLVKDLLLATGGIYLPQYNETVTGDNLFLLAETHAEKNFFPGSTQKKDFLGSLFDALQTKLLSGRVSYGEVLQQVFLAISRKDMLITFTDPNLQGIATVNNLSSSLWDGRQIKNDTVNDFLGINEANLGVNKVNYFVTRSVSHNIAVADEGTIVETTHVIYKNASQTNQWPGGDYKNYLRFILPDGAQLTDITINGQKQNVTKAITDPLLYEKKGFIPPGGLEVDQTEEEGKTIYGFLVTIPAGSTQDVGISYALLQKFPIDQSLVTYDSNLFKQPGVSSYPYVFSFSFPQSFAVFKLPQGATKNGNFVSLKKDVVTDQNMQIELVKQ